MRFFKTYLFFSGFDEGHAYLMDTIWYENNWWLCPNLRASKATGEKIPDRLILMDGLHVKFQEVNDPRYRFLLNNPLPKSVADGEMTNGYVVARYQPPSGSQTSH